MTTFFQQVFRDTPYWLQFINAGRGYLFSHTETIPGVTTGFVQFKTGSAKFIHIAERFFYSSEALVDIEFIEAPTITDGTTPLTPRNMNRISTQTSDVTVFDNPTTISGGTLIEKLFLVPSGTVERVGTAEIILKQNTTYIYKLTNSASTEIKVNINLFWYETDD